MENAWQVCLFLKELNPRLIREVVLLFSSWPKLMYNIKRH